MNDIVFADYVVVCETQNCSNAGSVIVVSAPAESPLFVCGVCSQVITNFKKYEQQ